MGSLTRVSFGTGMHNLKKIRCTAAVIALICFFLPWIQVSCGSAQDSLSGVDIARDGRNALWLIPLLLVLAIGASLLTRWRRLDFGALISFVAGAIGAYLMNRERVHAEDSSALLNVRPTGWLFLGLASLIVVAVTGAIDFLKPTKPP